MAHLDVRRFSAERASTRRVQPAVLRVLVHGGCRALATHQSAIRAGRAYRSAYLSRHAAEPIQASLHESQDGRCESVLRDDDDARPEDAEPPFPIRRILGCPPIDKP